jgi:hypothetical protein
MLDHLQLTLDSRVQLFNEGHEIAVSHRRDAGCLRRFETLDVLFTVALQHLVLLFGILDRLQRHAQAFGASSVSRCASPSGF